jgi:hypothetical protein
LNNKNTKRKLETDILRLTDSLIEKVIELNDDDIKYKSNLFSECSELASNLGFNLLEYLEGREDLLETMLTQLTKQKLPDPKIMSSFDSFYANLNLVIQEGIQRATEKQYANENLLTVLPPEEIQDFHDDNVKDSIVLEEVDLIEGDIAKVNNPLNQDNLPPEEDILKDGLIENDIPTSERNMEFTQDNYGDSDIFEILLTQHFGKYIKDYRLTLGLYINYYIESKKLGFMIGSEKSNYTDNTFYTYLVQSKDITIIDIPISKKSNKHYLSNLIKTLS